MASRVSSVIAPRFIGVVTRMARHIMADGMAQAPHKRSSDYPLQPLDASEQRHDQAPEGDDDLLTGLGQKWLWAVESLEGSVADSCLNLYQLLC
jgi:hypothetical protein